MSIFCFDREETIPIKQQTGLHFKYSFCVSFFFMIVNILINTFFSFFNKSDVRLFYFTQYSFENNS